MKSFCLILLALVVVARGGKVCKETSECNQGECCQIIADTKAIERRQTEEKTGTCESLIDDGDFCSGASIVNGYCGCHPGSKCTGFNIDETLGRRSIVPGWEWRCAKIPVDTSTPMP